MADCCHNVNVSNHILETDFVWCLLKYYKAWVVELNNFNFNFFLIQIGAEQLQMIIPLWTNNDIGEKEAE